MARDIVTILFVTCATLGSQLLLKSAVSGIAARTIVPSGLDWVLAAAMSPKVWLAITVQGIGFVAWLIVISRVKLGAAFAISGSFFYVALALASWALYGERLAPLQWGGIALVSVGVMLIAANGAAA